MPVPGSNLLNTAFRLIAKQNFLYYQYNGRETNSIGFDVAAYNGPYEVCGSVQPVPREITQQWGLDFQRTYRIFYTTVDLIDIQRDISGDQVAFEGQRYQCVQNVSDCFGVDGWVALLCVKILPPGQTQ